MDARGFRPKSWVGGTGDKSWISVTLESNEVQSPERALILAPGRVLGFLNLRPRIFERHGSVEEEGFG
jgi:hypothetical protein